MARRALGDDLAAPQQNAADDQEPEHPDQQNLDRAERPAVGEDACDRGGQEQRERDPGNGRREGQTARGGNDPSRERVVLPEAALHRARASAPPHPPGSGRHARA
jgi:hypothetical protein